MSPTADNLLNELEASIADLLKNFGDHDGFCSNHYQKKEQKPIPPCSLHIEALKKRKERVELAFEQFRLLRDIFAGGINGYVNE